MDVVRQLKYYRQKYQYTREMLASQCGVSAETVEQWEKGIANPDLDELVRLARLFHVSMDTLILGETEKRGTDLADTTADDNWTDMADTAADDQWNAPAAANTVNTMNETLINDALQEAMNFDEPNEEIQVFIEYLGRMMNCDRIYIFEKDMLGDYCNTYEWCNRGVTPQIDQLQSVPADDIVTWLDEFHKGHFICIEDLESIKDSDSTVYTWLSPQQIQSLLVFPLLGSRGFLGVDNPARAFVSETATLLELAIHYVECMLQRSDLVNRLLVESDINKAMDNLVYRASYYANLKSGRFFMNTEALSPLGYNFELHSMDDVYNILEKHPECSSYIRKEGFEKVVASGEATTVEFIFYTPDHMVRWARLSIRPFADSCGNVLQLYGTLQDTSGEHESIKRYNAFTSHLRGGMHVCYLSDPIHLAYASDNLCELVGYTREEFEEIVGDLYIRLIVPEDHPAFIRFVTRLSQNPGTVETCEYGLIRRDGSIVRVIDTMESVLDGNGIVYGYANVMDVSELRHTIDLAKEQELRHLTELDKQFEIVDALSREYCNIFLVDLETELAVIHKLNGYAPRGMDPESMEPMQYQVYYERYINDRVYPEDQEMMRKAIHLDTVRQKLREQEEYYATYRVLEDGEIRYFQFKYILLKEEKGYNGHPTKVIVAFKSVDTVVREEMERRRAITVRQDIINAFLKIYLVGFYVDLEDGTITELNFGEDHTASGDPKGDIASCLRGKEILPGHCGANRAALKLPPVVQEKLTGCDFASIECKKEADVWYEINLVAGARDAEDQILQYFIMIRDITAEKMKEIRQAEALKLSHIRELAAMETAYRDELTGVKNRAAYQKMLESIPDDQDIGIIYCDVNQLKFTNDTCGHEAGDRYLCRVVELIQSHFSRDSIYRIGGDEFVIIIPDISQENFFARMEDLTGNIRRRRNVAAAGAAFGKGKEKESLLRQAEQKMYEDKARGKGERP